eukprot:CAMPEP_0170545300 /NCGR_PEP_ID=MMETSP0211-20121228/3735_1 /TAXON_ID=311385 /ORGANISM="Pseudokeronopsis sp., Strain OXSARD2" /LENGTH=207 /DNA_ID=CAMNT_0010849159 /DNA_START=291 /DNA_END=914 /DNA_ORIENTATION=-
MSMYNTQTFSNKYFYEFSTTFESVSGEYQFSYSNTGFAGNDTIDSFYFDEGMTNGYSSYEFFTIRLSQDFNQLASGYIGFARNSQKTGTSLFYYNFFDDGFLAERKFTLFYGDTDQSQESFFEMGTSDISSYSNDDSEVLVLSIASDSEYWEFEGVEGFKLDSDSFSDELRASNEFSFSSPKKAIFDSTGHYIYVPSSFGAAFLQRL